MRTSVFLSKWVQGSIAIASLGVLSACSGAAGADETSVASAEFALTAQESAFGFESLSSWSASAGVLASSSVHSQGSASLSVTNFGYSELVSAPLGTLSGVTPQLSISVRPPQTPGWGTFQIFVTSPSLNLTNAWVGQASLQNLPANQFSEVVVDVPASIQQALSKSYSDLRVKLVLNVPYANSAWLLDDLHFKGAATPSCGAGVGSPYTIAMSGEDGVDPAHVEAMRCTFFTVYPLLVQRFNTAAATTVGMIFTDEPGVAWTSGTNVYYNKTYLAGAPLDSDVVVHETMHVVQAGYTGQVEGWIIEGTADFVRDEYGLNNVANGWSIPTGYAYGQNYLHGYGDAAAFFKWIDAHYRQNQRPVVDELDDIMRLGTYSDQTWVALTGHSVDDLWQLYSNNTAPVSASSGVTVYQDANYEGRAFTLARGTYAAIDTNARAINDSLSSLRIPAGYTVTVYDDDFSGTSAVYTADVPYVGDLLNDKISTIVIE